MPSILTVSHCSKRFSGDGGRALDVLALQDVSFEIGEGEILGLAGESGSGKTTLSRLLLGLEEPDEGEIYYHGTSFTSGKYAKQCRMNGGIQAIFQDPLASLNPVMRVEEIVAEPFRIQNLRFPGGSRRKVEKLLAQVGLGSECMNKRPDQLSGGEQQRVCIARALALQPGLLVADEPVSALDAELQGGILALIKASRDQYGLAVLLVAHDLGLFRGIADRVAIMYQGEIVEIGKTKEILSFPRHPYTKELLSATPPYTREMLLRVPETSVETISTSKNSCSYWARCPYAAECCQDAAPPVKKTDSGFYRCYF
ncbi:MAG: ABC transporter ATP-binding protein [Acidobacteria bacterium]|nr:ABC transporter ATP-binding protein [Acidobacteriota bacterium]